MSGYQTIIEKIVTEYGSRTVFRKYGAANFPPAKGAVSGMHNRTRKIPKDSAKREGKV